MKIFCPPGERTALVEIKLPGMDEPLFSIQVSDGSDSTQIEWDFLIVNDPDSPKFNTLVDKEGRDTLFGWAFREVEEEKEAMESGYFPGQARKGLALTKKTIESLEIFCRIFDIKSIRLEALFYHNAITYERNGFSYFSGLKQMKRINELFQKDGKLYQRLDNSSPFRKKEFSATIAGRSWAIHDGILNDIDDDILEDGWVSPIMYRMLGSERSMITFPDPKYW
ncbi:MAG: hypothetical protein JW882_19670 [Deltaproteobacteria bacterium]|nr:hypothetical protein [Deltaproteobacteria bacterium]